MWMTNSLTPTQYSMSESSQQSHAGHGNIRYVPYVIKESSYFCINHHFNCTLSIVSLPGVLTWLKTLIYWKNHHRATKVVSDISSLPCIDCLISIYCIAKAKRWLIEAFKIINNLYNATYIVLNYARPRT